MSDTVFEQILKIRDSGETNMFAVCTVQDIAFNRGFHELVLFIKDHKSEYLQFILTGEHELVRSKAMFSRKVPDLTELISRTKKEQPLNTYIIEKTIELDECLYKHFTENLLDDFNFIAMNIDLMYVDKEGVWHCILIKSKGSTTGILVESEGYDYARYSAIYKP